MSVVVVIHDLDSILRNSYMSSVLYFFKIIFEQVFHTYIKTESLLKLKMIIYINLHFLLPCAVKVM